MTKVWALIGLGLSAIFAIWAGFNSWGPIKPTDAFESNPVATAVGVLMMLFVVATLLERAIAVINSLVFSSEEEKARRKLKQAKAFQIADTKVAEFTHDNQIINVIEKEKALQKTLTKLSKLRLTVSLIAGTILAASGFQVLGFFIEPISFDDALKRIDELKTAAPENNELNDILTLLRTADAQNHVLNTMDILLTAGLLAGGSEGIATMVKYFKNNIDDTSAERAAERQSTERPSADTAQGLRNSMLLANAVPAKKGQSAGSSPNTQREYNWLTDPGSIDKD